MKSLYDIHGLMFWDQSQIVAREKLIVDISQSLFNLFTDINRAWIFKRVEAPLLMPKHLLNKNYTEEDIWTTDNNLCLRPETTPGSFVAAKHLLNITQPPLCVWQAGKSFRKEQHDKSYIHMSLDEFWQMEFQFMYSENTKADYMNIVCERLPQIIETILCPYLQYPEEPEMLKIIESDRLPSYSSKTMDLEIFNGHKMLEVCSISQRQDFNHNNLQVLEIAFGLDRLVSLLWT